MKKNKNEKNIYAIKEKEVSEEEKVKNQKDSNFKRLVRYIIPLIILIIIAIIYIPTSNNILLIPFAILVLITLFGWDASNRTCENCKKWNSVLWIKNDNSINNNQTKKKNIFGKEKTKNSKSYITKSQGKCKECGHICIREKIRKI